MKAAPSSGRFSRDAVIEDESAGTVAGTRVVTLDKVGEEGE